MNKNKSNRITAALYVVMALIIVSVVCITVFSVVSNRRGNETKVEAEAGETTPKTVKKPDVTRRILETDGVPEATAPKPSETEQPSERTSENSGFYCVNPADGYLLKEYSIDMPTFSITMNDYRVHKGIDIGSASGSPVMAFAEGKIKNVYNDPMMGNCVSIEHSNGLVSYYMGLSDEKFESVYEGAPVYCGQPIGSVGDSTLVEIAENDHVHFELTQNGKNIDPLTYVSYSPLPTDEEIAKSYEG